MNHRLYAVVAILGAMMAFDSPAETNEDSRVVAELDTNYQSAVERGDWQAMDRILHPDFVLVLGDGTVYSRQQLIDSARDGNVRTDTNVRTPQGWRYAFGQASTPLPR